MPFIPPGSDNLALFKAAAETLSVMALLVEELGAELCIDPAIVERHLSSLQTIDRLAQHLNQIANVIGSEDPVAAVNQVKLTELKDHLSKALQPSAMQPITRPLLQVRLV